MRAVYGRLLLLVSQATLAPDTWHRLGPRLLETAGASKPVVVLLEELPPLLLAKAPELQHLLSCCPVLHWDPQAPGFWEQLKFLLPHPSSAPSSPRCPSWQYDPAAPPSSDSTTASTRSTG